MTFPPTDNPALRRYRLGRSLRLKSRAEFERVFAARHNISDGHLVVYAAPNDLGRRRVGLAVGKRLGGAVVRNRYKRTLREAFRLTQHDLPDGFDYVLIPRKEQAPATHVYEQSLRHLAHKLAKRMA